jgi:hypothetical protein
VHEKARRYSWLHCFASDASKSIVEVTAVEIPLIDLLDIRTEKAIPLFKPFLIDLFECFEMILNTPTVG